MSEIENWRHKDSWGRRGKDFMVEVTRHRSELGVDECGEGPHRWCVYAYIYPSHPHFASFSGPHIWQDATQALPLHGGCSLLNYPMYEGKVTSVQVGADYHHLHDDRFTHYATADEARVVFEDAEELFEKLQAMAG